MAKDPFDERNQSFAPRQSRHSGGRWEDDKPGWTWLSFLCLGLIITCIPPLILWLASQ